jgi:peptidoglycan hydrolase-like protein with peptidoglycan-binding domain
VTREEFATDILHSGAWPDRLGAVQGLVAVMVGEDSEARWNPTDTTLYLPGATPFNSFGPNGEWHVWDYQSYADGVKATVETIKGLPPIVTALTMPDSVGGMAVFSAAHVVEAFDAVWAGTPINLYQRTLGPVQASWPFLGEGLVSGSEVPPLGTVQVTLPVLRYLDESPAVVSLKHLLGIIPAKENAEQFGNGTLEGVKYAQTAYGLPADGVVDGPTWEAIITREKP